MSEVDLHYSVCRLCHKNGLYEFENHDAHSTEHSLMRYDPKIKTYLYLNDTSEPSAHIIVTHMDDDGEERRIFYTGASHCPGCGRKLTKLDLDIFWDRLTSEEEKHRHQYYWEQHQIANGRDLKWPEKE